MPVTDLVAGTASLTGGTAPTPGLPAGLAAGKVMWALFYSKESVDGTVSINQSGWTGHVNHRDAQGLIALWSKPWESGDVAPTFTLTGHATGSAGDSAWAQVFSVDGADTADPMHLLGSISTWSAIEDMGPISGITPTVDGCMVVVVAGRRNDLGGSNRVANLTGDGLTWTEIAEYTVTTGSDAGGVSSRGEQAVAGAISNKTFDVTAGTGTGEGKGFMFAIEPVPPPEGAPVPEAHDTSTGTGTSVVLDRPGTQAEVADKTLVAVVDVEGGSNVTVEPPDGSWTSVEREDQSTNTGMQTFVKVAGASEPATYEFTLGLSAKWSAGIVRVRDADPADPVDVALGGNGASGNATAPDRTSTVDACLVLRFYSSKSSATWTKPSGSVEQWDAPNTTDGLPSNMLAWAWQATAGATGAAVAVPSVSAEWVAQTIVIKPAAGGTTHETASWQSSYVVDDHQTASWASSYVTRERVQATWQSSYTARERLQAAWASSYEVNAHEMQEWASSYGVAAHESTEWASSYTVQERQQASWGSSYTVPDHATASWQSSYQVNAHETASWQSSYGIAGHATAEWASSYAVRARVQAVWASSWGTGQRSNAAWASSWVTNAHVTQAWSSRYGVEGRASTEWQSSYEVQERQQTAWASSWTTQSHQSATWQSGWTTRAHVSISWQSGYGIAGRGSTAWASGYQVKEHTAQAWSSTWTTRERLTTSWQSGYGTDARLLATWGSSYDTNARPTTTWTSGYTVTPLSPPDQHPVHISFTESATRIGHGEGTITFQEAE